MMVNNKEIYFLPGTMCNQLLWTKLWPMIGDDYSLHHIDIPLVNNFSLIIEHLSNKLPSHPVNLLGFSLGGYIATLFALNYLNRVQRLCVVANSPTPLPTKEIKEREQIIALLARHNYSGITTDRIKQLLHPNNHQRSEVIELITNMDHEGGKEKLLAQLQGTTYRQDLTKNLPILEIPIHFYFGEEDKLVAQSLLHNLSNDNDHVTAMSIANSGHMLPLEAPEGLAGAIKTWLSC